MGSLAASDEMQTLQMSTGDNALDLKHETLLWVHHKSLRGMDAKAGGIKVFHAMHEPACSRSLSAILCCITQWCKLSNELLANEALRQTSITTVLYSAAQDRKSPAKSRSRLV